jgi:hypothetical protein
MAVAEELSMTRTALVAVALLAGCMVGEEAATDEVFETHADVEGGVLVLEGQELATELAASPSHEAGHDFVRLGVIFDAASPSSIELSVSNDGVSWSEWVAPTVHHIEQETTAAFVGQIELVEGSTIARYYRVRGSASFLRIEEMVFSQSENVETGEGGTGVSALDVGGLEINSRSTWGARASRCSSSLGKVYRMAIHHTETPTNDTLSTAARLRQIQSYHMDVRGWCDIGYHYLVSRDGRIWEGRPQALLGSHAGGANTGNIGIAIIGDHDVTPVTDLEASTVATLIRQLADRHGLATTRGVVKGHRQYKSTSCPGDKLVAQLDGIVEVASTGGPVESPGGDEPEEPGPGPAALVAVSGVLYAGDDPSARISGATISIGSRTTTTSSTGTWSLEVAAGTYTVTASKSGYVTSSISRSTASGDTWASFGLAIAGSATGSAIVQGVVYYGSSGSNRIPFATIQLSTGKTVTADGNGYFKIGSLPPGPITITATASGYAPASVSRTLVNNVTEWGSVRLAP